MTETFPLAGPLPTAELCTQVRLHYARQMHMMDGDDFAGFAGTFTEDGEFILAGGRGVLNGREAIRQGAEAAAARYNGGQPATGSTC
jgi:actinorhodin biosynthesis protein ActVIA